MISDPYEHLGVRRRINAAGALTRLGGAVMAPEVVEAMAAASRASVDIGELQDAASQRIAEATGAGLVDIGHNDRGTGAGVRGLEAWEIESALSPSVVAVAFSANAASLADLPTAAAVCRANGVPLIVDAAAQLPPKENLKRFVSMGADPVAFSGGQAR